MAMAVASAKNRVALGSMGGGRQVRTNPNPNPNPNPSPNPNPNQATLARKEAVRATAIAKKRAAEVASVF